MSGPGVRRGAGGDAAVVGHHRVEAGPVVVGDGDDLVADGPELADGPVVAAFAGCVVDVGVHQRGDAVDLGASAVVGGTGVHRHACAIFRHGNCRVPVEVVGQLAQRTGEPSLRAGIGGVVLHGGFLPGRRSGDGDGRACGGEGPGAAGPGGVVGQG